jgi:hypothetical protein
MICMTSPMTLTVEPSATAPALTLRPWQDSDIPAIVAAFRDEAMRRWLVSSVNDEDDARAHGRQPGLVPRRAEVRLRPGVGARTDAAEVPQRGTPAPAQTARLSSSE